MASALLIRLRPIGPWRYGPGDGAQDRVDTAYRSDRVFSAVTIAMRQLGFLDEWLDATARTAEPQISFGSLFPYQGDALFSAPPANLWPPAAAQLSAPNPAFLNKIRWSEVRFVPVSVIESLLLGQPIPADQWVADAASGCLLRRDRPGSPPFRVSVRSGAAVDRLTQSGLHVSSCACIEFEPDAGLWTVARFRDDSSEPAWSERLKACFRLLADTGFGGRRTSGWGKAETPVFRQGAWPGILLPKLGRSAQPDASSNGNGSLFWLLSLYSPAGNDSVDWKSGEYRIVLRGGRVEADHSSGAQK